METISINERKEVEILRKTTLLGKELTVYGDADNPLFLAKDVANWIEHSNASKMVSDADLSETDFVKDTLSTLTNSYSALFLTEDGLYEVLMQSRKPIAKQFKTGVKAILKEIRTKGAYMVTTPQDTPETIMAKAILYADKKIKEQANAIETLEERTKLQQKELYIAAPKVAYYDAAMESKDTYSTTAIAKDLGMCATKLNTRLNELCIQYQQSGTWYLYAKYQNKGLTRIVPYYFTRSDGSQGNNPRARWTEKGREFILNLRKEGKV
ncbi:phage antirepressor KilAC domain-containing protein [Bacteroides neonati]|uniref:phage antirepressor KilAC domain-containing protein n=1 Tax=Bacteroides neonati TaxID=1347393 RepID=UPI0004AD2FD1|nr:phage antirepressor KilAC domain-containing protein [Bacteroides neonati]